MQAVLPHWEGSVTVQQQCCCRIVKALPLPCEGSAATNCRQCCLIGKAVSLSNNSAAAVHRHCCCSPLAAFQCWDAVLQHSKGMQHCRGSGTTV